VDRETPDVAALVARLRALEDERAITRVILRYGPAADAGAVEAAAGLWLDDGVYDWNADAAPLTGRDTIARMLEGRAHQQLIGGGAAHFAGPPLVEVDGDRATALNYTMVLRNDGDRFVLWRASAVRWDLERTADGWAIRRRTNRLLDATGAGRELFADVMRVMAGTEDP
jgi:hypothetical protein